MLLKAPASEETLFPCFRLRVVSNCDDSGELHARAQNWVTARRRAPSPVTHLLVEAHLRARARVYFPGIAKIRDTRPARKKKNFLLLLGHSDRSLP